MSGIDINCVSNYGEFLGMLQLIMREADYEPWKVMSAVLAKDGLLPLDAFKIYLCPSIANSDDFKVLSAILACPDVSVGNVLHELMWHDWFYSLFVAHVLEKPSKNAWDQWDAKIPYGFLIVPDGQCPLLQDEGFSASLNEQRVEEAFSLTLSEMAKYLTYDLCRNMIRYEKKEDVDLQSWIDTHRAIVTPRQPVYLPEQYNDPADDQYAILRTHAKLITEIALQCCPDSVNSWTSRVF
jgi:hypothetical protein